jgi:type II restriction/modification system DNA methylase subunit YeeA
VVSLLSKKQKIIEFINWWKENCTGDEKGEAQIFLDRLFQAFGHKGLLEVGGKTEYRIRKGKGTSFADLVWKPIVLIEMKKRGTDLSKHYNQVFEYWLHLVPDRPKYVVLCNFDELWIYDLNHQLDEPLGKVAIEDLANNWGPLAFLFEKPEEPIFENDLIEVTASAADKVAAMFKRLVDRGIPKEEAQRFTLQCVLAMFSEDIELLPKYLFTRLVDECLNGESSYDLLGNLFVKMNEPGLVKFGRYKGVTYFNGGIFANVTPIELNIEEITLLREACSENWSKVKPAIFGTIFEDSMGKEERHAFGAHFTTEADIQKIVLPTIVRPWRRKIEEANTIKKLNLLLQELWSYKVLDPACGSGNFLYVAYREVKRLEKAIIDKISDMRKNNKSNPTMGLSFVTSAQFYGYDVNSFAVELAKITMMIARKLAVDELHIDENTLPLENLDSNIVCTDALFTEWPTVDAIIGNPPYQSKNKMQEELGADYLLKLRKKYDDVPGRADYCVYWFRKAHETMKDSARAGLVGTNTIKENYSRIGGLDYIVQNGGTIIEAVAKQLWSGAAGVHVSIVNWIKGEDKDKKILYIENYGNLEKYDVDVIPSNLSLFDITKSKRLTVNSQSDACYQGQTHGHEGFLLDEKTYKEIIAKDPNSSAVIFPYLTGREMIEKVNRKPTRFVIDFYPRNIIESQSFKIPFNIIKSVVLPTREEKALHEIKRNNEIKKNNSKAKVNRHHQNFYKQWWQLSYPRGEMIEQIKKISRYIVCSQVTKRPIFEFVSSNIRPNAALIVFPLEDDYSFGVLQSFFHWKWFISNCSTLREDYRYTSDTVFDTFPWPQSPTQKQVEDVAIAARELRQFRNKMLEENNINMRDLYRTLELPGKNDLRDYMFNLDESVRRAYGFSKEKDPLYQLFDLNQLLFKKEEEESTILGPGLPDYITKKAILFSNDCIN